MKNILYFDLETKKSAEDVGGWGHINLMGMSIGVNPVTGVCLPFVSYGGSFMLLSMTCLGILQSVYRHRKERNF